ncbi:MAG: SPOR domain-containing protein, partial [Acetobacteraceae bacterium]|nr:SPOR domain-containing protein [Acetobacteraceae bacterium]
VQLAAARSEEAARAEWQRLAARVPELQGRTPAVTRLEREGQPTLFRLRTAGFQDAAAARQFCEALQARQASCIVIGAN